MQVKRLISRRIRKTGSGIDLVADVNAVISVNVNEGRPATSETSTKSPPPPRKGDAGPNDRGRETA